MYYERERSLRGQKLLSSKRAWILSNNLISQLIIDNPEIPSEIGIIDSELILHYIKTHQNLSADTKIVGAFFNKDTKKIVLYLNNQIEDFVLCSEETQEQSNNITSRDDLSLKEEIYARVL